MSRAGHANNASLALLVDSQAKTFLFLLPGTLRLRAAAGGGQLPMLMATLRSLESTLLATV